MSIETGVTFPSAIFRFKDNEGVKEVTTEEYFNSKKVVLFAVPGAFTVLLSTYLVMLNYLTILLKKVFLLLLVWLLMTHMLCTRGVK